MKKILNLSLTMIVALGLTSCVQDLNTSPIDPNSTTTFNQGAAFSKCYASLALTGQEGAAGHGDVDGVDEGVSAFYRVSWELNEFPTDEGWWIWADDGVEDVRKMNWNGENGLVKGLYYRFIANIKYCNHFLLNATGTDSETIAQRAEVRFLRALNYWYLLDMFYVSPNIREEEISDTSDPNYYPEFRTRAELYSWLTKELEDVAAALPAQRIQRYRVDKIAAYQLLARTYLNGAVYNKDNADFKADSAYQKAADYAKLVMDGQYHLLLDSTVSKSGLVYSAYQKLFMGDNDVNGAADESPLLVYQDGFYCRNYGGSMFVIAAMHDKTGKMVPSGISEVWECYRTSPEMVYKFVDQTKAKDIKADEYHMRYAVGDDRCILCSYVDSTEGTWALTGGMASSVFASWACPKFTGVYSTADHPSIRLGSNSQWPDTDIPWLRVAEAYLTYAEAEWRLGKTDGLKYVNDLRDRANAKHLSSLTEQTLCDEWCREFWGEGRRRTDLIRFNRFAGSQADAHAYSWEGRRGQSAYVSVPEYFNWFPVPSDDKKANPNFKKQVIGSTTNPYAGQGGDGYVYVN